MLEKTKTVVHAIVAFLLGILGFCIGRRSTRSKTDDNQPNTERIESALSDAAGELGQAAGELGAGSVKASEVTDGIGRSQDQADSIGEHLQGASELLDAVITDTEADADAAARVSELLGELENRVGHSDEKPED